MKNEKRQFDIYHLQFIQDCEYFGIDINMHVQYQYYINEFEHRAFLNRYRHSTMQSAKRLKFMLDNLPNKLFNATSYAKRVIKKYIKANELDLSGDNEIEICCGLLHGSELRGLVTITIDSFDDKICLLSSKGYFIHYDKDDKESDCLFDGRVINELIINDGYYDIAESCDLELVPNDQ